MLTLKHLRKLRRVSILIDHHQGVRRCLDWLFKNFKLSDF